MEKKDCFTILIVDDSSSNIIALERLLEGEDRCFLTAGNGADALKMALHRHIDLILLDVQMKDMDGFEVAHTLKLNSKTREIPIIFASALNKEYTSILKGFAEGAVDYLIKPLDPEITRAKVSILLTMQKQKRELLEKNRLLEKSSLLISNSADIIGIIDAETLAFDQVNRAFTEILGYPAEEIPGKLLASFLTKEDMEIVVSLIAGHRGRIAFESGIVSMAGELKWLQWNVTVKDKKWFFNTRDITSQKLADNKIKKLNQELEDNLNRLEFANRELDAFSYSVSHDLRTPLRLVDSYSRILKEDYACMLDIEGQKIIDVIRNNAARMGKLIEDLLDFSKLGRKQVTKSIIDMSDLVTNVLDDMNGQIKNKAKVKINSLKPAVGDRSLITQVWANLLNNAIKYSSKKAEPLIEIGCQTKGNQNIYYIKDNGVGFDMKYADKLFNVFQRLHTPSEFEGTGVGLATIQRIILRHGGEIWAESQVNEGATFYFTLSD